MSAEKFYWKCQRWLLSDYLVTQVIEVVNIVEPGVVSAYKLTHLQSGCGHHNRYRIHLSFIGTWKHTKEFLNLDSEADPG